MTAQTFTAVFEKGRFRPLTKFCLPISEGQKVRLTVETPESPTGVLALATQVYEGLTEDQIDEVEQIILNRKDFFTNNEEHFKRINGLHVENWLKL